MTQRGGGAGATSAFRFRRHHPPVRHNGRDQHDDEGELRITPRDSGRVTVAATTLIREWRHANPMHARICGPRGTDV
jgi:hypothetical protein